MDSFGELADFFRILSPSTVTRLFQNKFITKMISTNGDGKEIFFCGLSKLKTLIFSSSQSIILENLVCI